MKRFAFFWLCACATLSAQTTLSLEQIGADPGLWPTEVMVVVDHSIPVASEGRPAKTRKVGPGKVYKVKSVDAKGVTVLNAETPITFKADETDLIVRSEQIKAQRDGSPANAASAAPAGSDSPAPAAPQQAVPATQPTQANDIAKKLEGILVRAENGNLEPYDASKLRDKKFIAVYFSASRNGPSREFTPAFVSWYARKKANADNFEVIFVSRDEDESSMKSYMLDERMPWPAVTFKWRESNPLTKYQGKSIPCLVILDRSGSVVADTFYGDIYVGPVKPLKALDDFLKAL